MKYQYKEFIDFQKADPGGIAFFAEAYAIAHRSLEHFIQHIGINWDSWFNHPEIAAPLRHTEANHLKPIFAGKTVTVKLHISYLSATSFTANYSIYDENNDECCQVKTTHTFVNKNQMAKTNIPIEYSDKLKNYLQD